MGLISKFRHNRLAALAARRARARRLAPAGWTLEPRQLLATFTVTSPLDSGPGTLRRAILDANANAGADTVRFSLRGSDRTIALTSGPLSISDDLRIDGPGAGRLTVSGGGASSVFVIAPTGPITSATTALNVTIEDLTIADGQATGGVGIGEGGGIRAILTDLSVSDSAFLNNSATGVGGGIFLNGVFLDESGGIIASGGSLSVEDSTFEDNSTGSGGAAIFVVDASTRVQDSTFDSNRSDFGGGGAIRTFNFAVPSLPLVIEGSTFRDNRSGSGGAVAASGQARIVDSVFRNNQSQEGGAVLIFQNFNEPLNRLTVVGSRFEGNSVSGPTVSFAEGGAIYVDARSELIVRDSTFRDNSVSGTRTGSGGAIFGQFNSVLTIQGSQFESNLARTTGNFADRAGGGAIFGNDGTALSVIDSQFLDNRAESKGNAAVGGAIRNSSRSNFGAPSTRALTIRSSRFESNAAVGLVDTEPSTVGGATALGGAVSISGGPAVITDSSFRDNRAQGGSRGPTNPGGFASGGAVNSQGGGPLTISGSFFRDNEARGGAGANLGFPGSAFGGAISDEFRFEGDSTITDTRFVENRAIAGFGTGGTAGGGAINFQTSPGVFTRIQVIGNQAVGGSGANAGNAQGGGLNLSGPSYQILDSQIVNNRVEAGDSTTSGGRAGDARGGGVAAFTNGDGLTVSGSRIASNRIFGGFGSTGGNAFGGGLFATRALTVLDSTIVANGAIAGPNGQGFGGGIYLTPGATFTINSASRVRGNRATTAGNNIFRA